MNLKRPSYTGFGWVIVMWQRLTLTGFGVRGGLSTTSQTKPVILVRQPIMAVSTPHDVAGEFT